MIIKSLSRTIGVKQIIEYIFLDDKSLFDSNKNKIIIRHNIRGNTINNWVKEFNENEKNRVNKRINNVKIYHTIISFSSLDTQYLTIKVLKDFATHFIKLRGEKNLFLGTSHYDKEHIHLHILMSGIQYLTGKSNRISREEFKQLKLSMDEYQREKYPLLVNSLFSI